MTSASEAANDAMIREFLKAWERRDTDYIVSCFTDDAVYHNVPLKPIVGKSAIREFVRQYEDVAPGHFEIHHQVGSGDVVMNERTDYVTVNGREIAIAICGVFEIEDGHIKAWRDYYDGTPFTAA